MCPPVVMGAMLAISIASAAAEAKAQSDQAQAQKHQNGLETQNALQNVRNQYTQAQQNGVGNNAAAYQKQEQDARATRAAVATGQTSAGESGVGGNSVAELTNEYYGNSAQYQSDVEMNRNMGDEELMSQMQGFQAGAQSDINREPIPNGPSPLGTGLKIASSAASDWNSSGMTKYGAAKGWWAGGA